MYPIYPSSVKPTSLTLWGATTHSGTVVGISGMEWLFHSRYQYKGCVQRFCRLQRVTVWYFFTYECVNCFHATFVCMKCKCRLMCICKWDWLLRLALFGLYLECHSHLPVSTEALTMFPEGKAGGLCLHSVCDRKAPGGNISNAPSDDQLQ